MEKPHRFKLQESVLAKWLVGCVFGAVFLGGFSCPTKAAPQGVGAAGAPASSVRTEGTDTGPIATSTISPLTSGSQQVLLPAPSATAKDDAEFKLANPVDVRFRETLIVTLRTDDGGLSVAERAKRANGVLERSLTDADPRTVHVEQRTGRAIIFVDNHPVIELTDADARVAGEGSLELYAASAAARIRDVLSAEEQRSEIAKTVFSITLVVAFAIAFLYLLKKIGDFSRKIRDFIDKHPEKIPAIRLKSIEVVRPHVLRSGFVVCISLGRWLIQLSLIYLWLVLSLSQFALTRDYAPRLTKLVLAPLSSLAERIAALFPVWVLAAMFGVVLLVLLRFVALFFEGVERRETELEWLDPGLARPTSWIVRAALVVVALVLVAPVITGNGDGALPRFGMLLLIALTFGAIPILASVLIGIVVLYAGKLHVGSLIRVGDVQGRVIKISLTSLHVESSLGAVTFVPHFLLLSRSLTLRLPEEETFWVTLATSLSPQEVEIRLCAALEPLVGKVELTLTSADSKSLRYKLRMTCSKFGAPRPNGASVLTAIREAELTIDRFESEEDRR